MFQKLSICSKVTVIWEGFGKNVDLEKYVIFTGKFFYQQGYRYYKVFFKTALAFNLSCQNNNYPKLDTRISFVRSSFVTLRVPPLKSETCWTGELWPNRVLLILEN